MHPLAEVERRKHKKKRLVQRPNSYFMDVKCPGCYRITTVFSHAQRVVPCGGCSYVLCQPKGGKCRLTEGKKSSLRTVLCCIALHCIVLCSTGPLIVVCFLSGSFK
ncbi:RS272 protein, partial [Polyodon spathula]|nr:RS272 protein [Polyodon spathula]